MSATSSCPRPGGKPVLLGRHALANKGVDIVAAKRPVIVEIGDHRLHERLRQGNGAVFVAEVVVENRKRQLLRALPLVGPLESVFGETFDLVVLVEPLAIDRDDETIDGAFSRVGFHYYTATVARVNVST